MYRLLGEQALASEIMEMRELIERDYEGLRIEQDLGLGMMLWLSHFFPQKLGKSSSGPLFTVLDGMWIDPSGYFCRAPHLRQVKFAFTNYGVSLGLQAVGHNPDRVVRLNQIFRSISSR